MAMDYEACYAALQLNFGAGLKEVNERWRKLSRIHHPDRHMCNQKEYQLALEKQKELNNARDILKSWFQANPNTLPPRKQGGATQNNAQDRTANSTSSTQNNRSAGQSQSTQSHSQQKSDHTQKKQQQQSQSQNAHNGKTTNGQRASSRSHESASSVITGWLEQSDFELSTVQKWAQKIDTTCHAPGDFATAVAMGLCFAAVFAPLWVLTTVIGALFPDLAGHFPEWLSLPLLFCSGYITTYLFRWYFTEIAIIKLQQKQLYFRTDRTIQNATEFAKVVISKQVRPGAVWQFGDTGSANEAILEFDEQVLPDYKQPRRLVLRFKAKETTSGTVLAFEVRARSPFNSFACKNMTEVVIKDLKQDMNEIAA